MLGMCPATIKADPSMNDFPIEAFLFYVFEISSKLEDDFMYEDVSNTIKSQKYTIKRNENGFEEIVYKNEYLLMSNYYIQKEMVDGVVEFSFGLYLD